MSAIARSAIITRVVVTSDLHLGITGADAIETMVERIADETPDLTIIAGDIGEGLSRVDACLGLFADVPGTVAVLAGNHDVWACEGHSSQELWEDLLPACVHGHGYVWLEDEIIRLGDIAVVGTLGWYDYSAADTVFRHLPPEYFAAQKRQYNNDARYVDWPWSDVAFATSLGDRLCARLAALEHDEHVRDVFVATHVPVYDVQLCRKPSDARWGMSNAYFGNLTLGQRIQAYAKVRTVVSGHTHIVAVGHVARAGMHPIQAAVLGSDYHHPTMMLKIWQ